MFIICVTFLFKAETICKDIFQIKSAVGLTGELSKSGAAGIALIRQVGPGAMQLFKGKKTKTEEEDEAEDQRLNNRRRQLEQNNSNNRSRELSSGGGGGEAPRIDEESLGESEDTEDTQDRSLAEEYDNAKAIIDAGAMDFRLNRFRGTWDANLGKNGFTNFMKNVGRNVARNAPTLVVKGIRSTAGLTLRLAFAPTRAMPAAASGQGAHAVISNALVFKDVGNMLGKAADKTLKLAVNPIKGKIYQMGVQNIGNQDQVGFFKRMAANRAQRNLEEGGVDVEKLFGGSKGDMIRKALAASAAGMVKGGKAKAELDESSIVVKETRENYGSRTSSRS